MIDRKRVCVVFGTRPEAIKLAPVVRELARHRDTLETHVVVTAQHREMLDQVLDLFGIVPDHDLNIMTVGQTLADISTRALTGLSPLIEELQPDCLLVQGDTTTTFIGALVGFYHHVAVGHVEAGLRTGDLARPFPEEANRRLTSQIATWHFAPTELSRQNLLADGIAAEKIVVTGNTVVDALLDVADLPFSFDGGSIGVALASGCRIILVTAHRRENWGEPYAQVCQALRELTARFSDVHVLFASHANPALASTAADLLGTCERVSIIGPQPYLPFVKLMQASTLIISDSGGIQEEAPTFGKPALVLRDATERPEAVDAGVVKLVGTDTARIVAEASHLLSDASAYASMAHQANPFGDGHAAEKIVAFLESRL